MVKWVCLLTELSYKEKGYKMSIYGMPVVEERDLTDPEQARDFTCAFLNNTTFYLATVDEQGHPANRPMSLITQFENKLVFATAKYKDVAQELSHNPYISITAYIKSVAWLRLDAKATEITSEKLVQQFKDENPKHYEIYLSKNDEENIFYALEETNLMINVKGHEYHGILS